MVRIAGAAALAAAVLTSARFAAAEPVPRDWKLPVGPQDPWGIHIAYGVDTSSEMTIMWSTRANVSGSVVQYGPASDAPALAFTATGDMIQFGDSNNWQQIHRVRLTGLNASTRYNYVVGDGGAYSSAVMNFTTPDYGNTPTFAVYGDMGISLNAQLTMPWLERDLDAGLLDVVVHIGDAAYNLESSDGLTGDAFMLQIQPVASRVPYHICPGNHESANDFYEYRMRLGAGMPAARNTPSSGGNGTFHSVNIGPVHWVLVSSEVYFSNQPHSGGLVAEQEAWLAQDLAAVDRSVTPFVVLGLHQPFYCSPNDDDDDCHQAGSLVRGGLEKIIYEGGVDLVFGAHEHSYERNYPVYKSSWDSSRTGAGAYVYPEYPVHILSGAAGCPEDQDRWQAAGNPFSAVRINDYGYGRLSVVNETALSWEYVDNIAGAVKDTMLLVKKGMGPSFPPAAADAWRAAHGSA